MRGRGGLGFAWVSFALAFALAFVLGAHPGQAQEGSLIARVEATLESGVEASSAHDAIVALGEQGELALRAVFEHESAAIYVRLRALTLLSQFETEDTARYFAQLVRAAQHPDGSLGALHPARSPLVLRRALEGLLPIADLPAAPLPSLDELTFCLSHRDAHVRKAAADLLAKVADVGAESALTKLLTSERSAMVRGRVQQALTSRSAALRRAR